ncbi:MAG: ATP-binding protein [Candidatus Competibacter sp.]
MNAPYHSTFTPSQSDPETLEDLFVAREKLAQRILDGIQESAAGANKHQRLLIGPRGIGKTHLVALLHHRVRRDAELDKRLRIAWLPEDPYIAGYHNLLLLILQTLQQNLSRWKICASSWRTYSTWKMPTRLNPCWSDCWLNLSVTRRCC